MYVVFTPHSGLGGLGAYGLGGLGAQSMTSQHTFLHTNLD